MAKFDRFSHEMPWERETENEENDKFCECDCCGDWIRTGDKFLMIDGKAMCLDCIEYNLETAI